MGDFVGWKLLMTCQEIGLVSQTSELTNFVSYSNNFQKLFIEQCIKQELRKVLSKNAFLSFIFSVVGVCNAIPIPFSFKMPQPVVISVWAACKGTTKYNVFQCLFVVPLSCSARNNNNNKNLSSSVRGCHFHLLVKHQQQQQQQHMSSNNGCKKPDI